MAKRKRLNGGLTKEDRGYFSDRMLEMLLEAAFSPNNSIDGSECGECYTCGLRNRCVDILHGYNFDGGCSSYAEVELLTFERMYK